MSRRTLGRLACASAFMLVVGWMPSADVTARQLPNEFANPGIGMVGPLIEAGATLYFFGPQEPGAYYPGTPPVDSITFAEGEHYVDIATAPPWLVPEVLKLDYQMLYFRAVTLTRFWVEIVVNTSNGQTAWVHRESVAYQTWPDFLLNVFAVEPLDDANGLRARPFDYSEASAIPDSGFLHPVAVRGDWLQVRHHGDDGATRDGWLRWRDADGLAVSYSLLS